MARCVVTKLTIFSVLLAVITAVASGTDVGSAQTPLPARLAFLHMSADAPALDVYIDSARVVDGLAFRDTSPYIGLSPGTHTVQVSLAKHLDAALNTTVTLSPGASFTWVLSGLLSAADVTVPLTPDLQFQRTVQLSDNAGDGADARPRLRAVNASPGAGPLDVRIESSPALGVATALLYGSVSPYLSVDPGTYTISLTGNGAIVASIPAVTLQVRTAYTLVLGGLVPAVIATAASNTVQGFQPVILTDQTSQRSSPLTKGCNQVILAVPAGTAVASVLLRVDNPGAVTSMWRFDNATKVLKAGYFADAAAPVDYLTTQVTPEAAYICVNATTAWSPYS